MKVSLCNPTFTALDLSEFSYARNLFNSGISGKLMSETPELHRVEQIAATIKGVFEVGNVAQTYDYR